VATLRTDFKVVNVTEKRKRRSKSVGSAAKNTGVERATSLTPTSVLETFRAHKKPLKWPEIRDLAGVRQGADVDQLRRVLRGLCHAGDLHIDSHGAYQLAAAETSVDGVIRKNDRGRLVLLPKAGGDALPVRLTRDSRLRVGDTVHARLVEGQAVISAVTTRSSEPVIGRAIAGPRGWYVVAEGDFRGRLYIVPNGHGPASDGDTVAAEVIGEESFGLTGRIVSVIAPRDDLHAASITLLRAHGVPVEWPFEVDEAVQGLPDRVDPALHGDREDVTDIPLVTIDGEDARDFDDAVYCRPRPKGGWRLMVAIADVGHYVKLGSALDHEARDRGNSVYLPDRVVPMLPEALSNGLCSLRPQEHRLCMVCDMQVSELGKITSYRFYSALMFSRARLTYTQVAAFIDAGYQGFEGEVSESLKALHQAYKALLAAREERGALDFDAPEQKLILENGLLERIEPVVRNDAHRLIEEAMISANVCAARFLEKHEALALYRVHEGPTPEKFDLLRQTLAYAGIRLSDEAPTPKTLQGVAAQIGDRPDKGLLETMILRSMMQARYSPKNLSHFGLALTRYMHFTSPIRRYADLVVHRAIAGVLKGDYAPQGGLEEIGEHLSLTERRADEVSRGVADWLKCEFAAQFVGETFAGTVVAVTDFGVFIELDKIFIQGLLHVSNLGDDYFEFYPAAMSLVGERSGRRIKLGDKMQVILADVDVESRKIDLLVAGTTGGKRQRRGRS
jgi:ribonuclease R